MTPLRFGILIEQGHSISDLLERVLRYEALGFDTVCFADCFADPFAPEGIGFEVWTLLAGLAAQTSRIRLGPLITHVVYELPHCWLARQ